MNFEVWEKLGGEESLISSFGSRPANPGVLGIMKIIFDIVYTWICYVCFQESMKCHKLQHEFSVLIITAKQPSIVLADVVVRIMIKKQYDRVLYNSER